SYNKLLPGRSCRAPRSVLCSPGRKWRITLIVRTAVFLGVSRATRKLLLNFRSQTTQGARPAGKVVSDRRQFFPATGSVLRRRRSPSLRSAVPDEEKMLRRAVRRSDFLD